jgi:hypothetical protein
LWVRSFGRNWQLDYDGVLVKFRLISLVQLIDGNTRVDIFKRIADVFTGQPQVFLVFDGGQRNSVVVERDSG